jgi:hypothetical protein
MCVTQTIPLIISDGYGFHPSQIGGKKDGIA